MVEWNEEEVEKKVTKGHWWRFLDTLEGSGEVSRHIKTININNMINI